MSQEAASTKLRILVADGVSPEGLSPLTADDRFDVIFAEGWSRERFLQELASAEGLVVRSATRVDEDLLEAASRLRVVGRAGVGVDNIDLEAATRRGVPVLNAPEGNTISAAELTFALLLAMARHVVAADRSVRVGEWSRSRFGGQELRGKSLGLVGLGRIGAEVASRAQAFGMRVMAFDPYLSLERAEALNVDLLELGLLLELSDFVSLHVPLTPSTAGMIGREELARMKPSAMLVNVARGGLVDEGALAEALAAGGLAGAALDVYGNEPLSSDSPLRQAPNIVFTPHLGASTREAQDLVATEIATAVRDALLEGDLTRAVNAPALSGETLRSLRPLLDLGEKLGRLVFATSDQGMSGLEVRYGGEEPGSLRPLVASVMVGLLRDVIGGDHVNFVNAPHLAAERGIHLTSSSSGPHPVYGEYVEVTARAASRTTQAGGALLGRQHARILQIDGYRVNIVPEGTLLVLRNRDVPGVIGKVGTVMGEHGLNIASYTQARRTAGGEALAAISVDGPVPQEVVDALAEIAEVHDARVARLT